MGSDLYREFPAARAVFDQVRDILGFDIASLCFEGPKEALDLTVNTQTAVLTMDIAIFEALRREMPLAPVVLAGHSLGEYAALFAAGALSLEQLFPLVRARARYHQEAVPLGEGAMAAILGPGEEAVAAACRQVCGEGQEVTLAIHNAPGQTVVSGHTGAVERVVEEIRKSGGGQAVKLPISVPCHCDLLARAAERLRADLEKIPFGDFPVPVIPNCDPGVFYTRETARDLLCRQIVRPVRWKETIERMTELGVDTILEAGPKRTLTALIKRIDRRLRLLNAENADSVRKNAALLGGETERPLQS
jgi:[acyl-carrier-protein] S-malonyltransferase